MLFVTVLALVVLVRDVLPTVQGVLRDENGGVENCGIVFLVWWIAWEIVVESLPLSYLLASNNRFLRDQHQALADKQRSLVESPLVSSDNRGR
jgi:hypothetical protein